MCLLDIPALLMERNKVSLQSNYIKMPIFPKQLPSKESPLKHLKEERQYQMYISKIETLANSDTNCGSSKVVLSSNAMK